MATGTEKMVGAAAAAATVAAAAGAVKTLGGLSAEAPPASGLSKETCARFLTQATFGPSEASITELQNLGLTNWINAQLAIPFPTDTDPAGPVAIGNPTPGRVRGQAARLVNARVLRRTPHSADHRRAFVEYFWTRALTGPDQLRLRMQFALSQVFVISRVPEELTQIGMVGVVGFWDMLGQYAFGNWRDLIEQIVLNPVTGFFLTYLENRKEDLASGRTPDENFARELMQLYALGTVKLNMDGTPVLGADGAPVPTYTSADIKGLAKVFTGLAGWTLPPNNDSSFGTDVWLYDDLHPGEGKPVNMVYFNSQHSISEKRFLGTVIPATTTANAAADVKIALDALFNHQNTAPFLAKRLIQQLVTSNPSARYVGRVAAVFANNGQGVRGDLGATLRAVLMDREARDATVVSNANFGKLREPIMRVANWARAFEAFSSTGVYGVLEARYDRLSQEVLAAPSVFNFWRATYVPPGRTNLGSQGMVAPEFQLVSELTTANYANLALDMVNSGVGDSGASNAKDVRSNYVAEKALAHDPDLLLDRVNLLLFYGQMSAPLRAKIREAVTSIAIPTSGNTDTARTNRAKTAVLLSMVSGEYLAQR